MTRSAHHIAIVGASGRMGDRVCAMLKSNSASLQLSLFDEGDTLDFTAADVVIDFSMPDATTSICSALLRSSAALVTGVTGRCASQTLALEHLSKTHPVLVASNFSFGVHVLNHLVERAAEILDTQYHIEIVEAHHHHKQDLPSGTALSLARSAARGRDCRWDDVYADRGVSKIRLSDSEIGVTGYRGGHVVGDHHVHFLGAKERLELTHSASDRDVFAEGAVRAAFWIVGQTAGLYTMGNLVAEALERSV